MVPHGSSQYFLKSVYRLMVDKDSNGSFLKPGGVVLWGVYGVK
jgi:hypothetical protein